MNHEGSAMIRGIVSASIFVMLSTSACKTSDGAGSSVRSDDPETTLEAAATDEMPADAEMVSLPVEMLPETIQLAMAGTNQGGGDTAFALADGLEDCSVYLLKFKRDACLQRNKEKQMLANTPPPILVIGSGGWSSCVDGGGNHVVLGGGPIGSLIWDSFQNLIKTMDKVTGANTDWLVTCLKIRSPANPFAPLNLVSRGGGDKVVELVAPNFPAVLADYITRVKPKKIYMVGHSYGGWVVTNATEQINMLADVVAPLDPIDAVVCKNLDNLSSAGTEDCKHTPNFNWNAVLSHTRLYADIWQPKGSIHSGPVNAQSPRLMNIQHTTTHPLLSAEKAETMSHRFIGFDATAWRRVCSLFLNDLGQSPSNCTDIQTGEMGAKL